VTRREALHAALGGLPSTIVPIVIVGGILLGVFSPTESAAAAALAALVVGRLIHKELDLRELPDMLLRTAVNSTMVLFLIATANIFGWVIIFEEVPQRLTLWLTEFSDDPFVFMLLVNASLLLIGVCINLVLGKLTPPVGTGLFISSTLANVKPGRIFIALAPFLMVTITVLVLLSWQPWLVTMILDWRAAR